MATALSDAFALCSPQGDVDLLHSQAYLEAVLRFAAHIQALAEKEHQLLGKSAVPETHQVL